MMALNVSFASANLLCLVKAMAICISDAWFREESILLAFLNASIASLFLPSF